MKKILYATTFIQTISENNQLNQEIINEIIQQNYVSITQNIEKFLLEQVEKNKSSGLILGLSGGIDSAVLAYLCKRVLKEKTLVIIMPDTEITPRNETEDALKMVELTGLEYKLIDIKPIVNEYLRYLEPDERAEGNLRARIRTNILYYYANAKNFLVLGSSDKSEYLLGYFTKYGDGASDLTPIISLYKLQVREIAKFLGVPKNVIEKKSSPHLWKDHEAEKELGASYEDIDSILYCIFEKKLPEEEIANKLQIGKSAIEKIQRLHLNSEHKRSSQQKPFSD
ncbi:MAG: nadE [Nitrosarchaeum sp.]|nr:nadE [Nitrosarchaeum sp.]